MVELTCLLAVCVCMRVRVCVCMYVCVTEIENRDMKKEGECMYLSSETLVSCFLFNFPPFQNLQKAGVSQL